MRKNKPILLALLVFASLTGIFGQDLAYILHDLFSSIHPITYLTIITMTSIGCFLLIPIFQFFLYKKDRKHSKSIMGSIWFSMFIGVPISLWEIFVLAMWWG